MSKDFLRRSTQGCATPQLGGEAYWASNISVSSWVILPVKFVTEMIFMLISVRETKTVL